MGKCGKAIFTPNEISQKPRLVGLGREKISTHMGGEEGFPKRQLSTSGYPIRQYFPIRQLSTWKLPGQATFFWGYISKFGGTFEKMSQLGNFRLAYYPIGLVP
jgi:hypothetical protein